MAIVNMFISLLANSQHWHRRQWWGGHFFAYFRRGGFRKTV